MRNWQRNWYWVCKNNSITHKRMIKTKGEEIKISIGFLFFQITVEYITNYEVMYDINEKDEKSCKFVEEKETEWAKTCELVKNSFVVKYEKWFDVEIDINIEKITIDCFMIYHQN